MHFGWQALSPVLPMLASHLVVPWAFAHSTPQAVRSLCWEPSVASDKRFPKLLSTLNVITPRQIQGLVHSLHRVWSTEIVSGAARRFTEEKIAGYTGKHRLVRKWREQSAEVIGSLALA